MAGLSSRFLKNGYKYPKYYLNVGNMNLFQASLSGFSKYFESDGFCFIYLDRFIDDQKIRDWCGKIGLKKSNLVTIPLSGPTLGQADTVRKGINYINSGSINSEETVIFNIDTIYRKFKKARKDFQTYLDVTKLPGDHWSFVVPDKTFAFQASRVVEKSRISDYCSVGLYQFRSGFEYLDAYQITYFGGGNAEHYVAPMYQSLIDRGDVVRFREFPSSRFDFLGTPAEYTEFLKKNKISGR